MVAILVALTFVVILTVDYFVQRAERRRRSDLQPSPAGPGGSRVLPGEMPPPLRPPLSPAVFFDPAHIWARLQPTGVLEVGTDYLPATLLGAPDRILLREPGSLVARGETLASLERGCRTLRLRAPFDGIVREVNEDLRSDPARLRHDPFDTGWIYRLSPTHLAPTLRGMRVGEEAREWNRRENARLRDLLVQCASPRSPVGATLNDGGFPAEGLARHLDSSAWNRLTFECFGIAS